LSTLNTHNLPLLRLVYLEREDLVAVHVDDLNNQANQLDQKLDGGLLPQGHAPHWLMNAHSLFYLTRLLVAQCRAPKGMLVVLPAGVAHWCLNDGKHYLDNPR
uniref:Legumin-like protein Mac i 2 (Fragments) n=1 Tax=Macadamia integrifolia TaxID=60698 RepID=11S1_MACIN|nr:RecName: Full=Legumin-like protein Mac i 2; AltName: Full=11S globulin seed storage protein Mac i 2; AltName: Allergen=Mac i 2 [Macadamia integrifolia]